jgi:hypothetical protein
MWVLQASTCDLYANVPLHTVVNIGMCLNQELWRVSTLKQLYALQITSLSTSSQRDRTLETTLDSSAYFLQHILARCSSVDAFVYEYNRSPPSKHLRTLLPR